MIKRRHKHNTLPHEAVLLQKDSPFAMKEAYNAIRTKLIFAGRGGAMSDFCRDQRADA
jgi:hypothetical protein